MQTTLGVVFPAYRPDAERLVEYVTGVCETVEPTRARVELDGADEVTLRAIAEALPAVRISANPSRRGKGAAVTAGFEALAADVDTLLFLDADGSTPASEIAEIVEPVATGRAAIAAGSRRHPGSRVTSHQTLARRRLGDAFAWTARQLLEARLYDYQCGAKAIASGAWRQLRPHLYEAEFAWDVELLGTAGALGLEITEVPIRWEDAPGSVVDPVRTSLDMARALLTVRRRARRLSGGHREKPAGSDPLPLVDREQTAVEEAGE